MSYTQGVCAIPTDNPVIEACQRVPQLAPPLEVPAWSCGIATTTPFDAVTGKSSGMVLCSACDGVVCMSPWDGMTCGGTADGPAAGSVVSGLGRRGWGNPVASFETGYLGVCGCDDVMAQRGYDCGPMTPRSSTLAAGIDQEPNMPSSEPASVAALPPPSPDALADQASSASLDMTLAPPLAPGTGALAGARVCCCDGCRAAAPAEVAGKPPPRRRAPPPAVEVQSGREVLTSTCSSRGQGPCRMDPGGTHSVRALPQTRLAEPLTDRAGSTSAISVAGPGQASTSTTNNGVTTANTVTAPGQVTAALSTSTDSGVAPAEATNSQVWVGVGGRVGGGWAPPQPPASGSRDVWGVWWFFELHFVTRCV